MRFVGPTADYYEKLSAIGAAPRVVKVTADAIITVKHLLLTDWLDNDPPQADKAQMAEQIRDLLQRVHQDARLCHRDVHIRNIVLTDGDGPLLIDPSYCTPAHNGFCYDLYGSERSGVAIPEIHLAQGHNGIWWGSNQAHDSLLSAFGPWPLGGANTTDERQ